MNTLICVACSHNVAMLGGTVCARCSNRHHQALLNLELDLIALTPHRGKGGASSARPPMGFGSASPARDDVIVELDPRSDAGPEGDAGVMAKLHSWVQMIREERGLNSATRVTPTSESLVLRSNHEWICQQDWAGDLFAEIRTCERRARALLGLAPDRPVGECTQPECPGKVYPTRDNSGVECKKCGRVYEGSGLLELGTKQERRLLDQKGMALLLGVSVRTVQRNYDVAEYRNSLAMYDVDDCIREAM